MASANLLGKLLASYLSTSNDTLAVSFRAHYAATGSPSASVSSTTLSPALHIRRKPASPRLTSATFTYRWFESEQRRIIQLYQCLLRAGWIAPDTNPDDFLSLFSGRDSNCKIHWTGKKTYLVYLFKTPDRPAIYLHTERRRQMDDCQQSLRGCAWTYLYPPELPAYASQSAASY